MLEKIKNILHIIKLISIPLSIIGIIWLIFFAYFPYGTIGFYIEGVVTAVVFIFILLLLIYGIRTSIRFRREERIWAEKKIKSNPDKYRSSIDEITGIITLLSHDYPHIGSQRWVVNNTSITIHNKGQKTIPFSQINTLTASNGSLSFELSGGRQTIIGGTTHRSLQIPDGQITYNPSDNRIVREIQARVSSFTSNQVSSNPTKTLSVADEISKLKNLLDEGTLTQEEFNHKKSKLLGLD